MPWSGLAQVVAALDSNDSSVVSDAISALAMLFERQTIGILAGSETVLRDLVPNLLNVRLSRDEWDSACMALSALVQRYPIGSDLAVSAIWAIGKYNDAGSIPIVCWYLRACWPDYVRGWQQALYSLDNLLLYRPRLAEDDELRRRFLAEGALEPILLDIVKGNGRHRAAMPQVYSVSFMENRR